MKHSILLYDGSFEGLLTAIFHTFEYKLVDTTIQIHTKPLPLFGDTVWIDTDKEKAQRVWKFIKSKTKNSTSFYYTFLSERENMESTLLAYTKHILDNEGNIKGDYGHTAVLQVAKIAKMVGREKHRMEAFARFRLTKDNIYFASIEPDFNVLPIILSHFKSRFADQQWIIYDLKRKYGIQYNLVKVTEIEFDFTHNFKPFETSELLFTPEELECQELWKNYFKSTNIESRKNMKLHLRHIPKRYWKHLSEKQQFNH